MKIHEYQAKEILSKTGIPVPFGCVAETPGKARDVAKKLGERCVIKSQVHAGGRGKAGGIKIVQSSEEAESAAASLIGKQLVTSQTSAEGVLVSKVLVEEMLMVDKELYLGIVIDGSTKSVVVIVSQFGGIEIEEVAENNPGKIFKVKVDPVLGLMPYQSRQMAHFWGLEGSQIRSATSVLGGLFDLFLEHDCSLVEINPLVITTDGRMLAADVKMDIDDDAMFRHKDLAELYDVEQEDPFEARAGEFGISYVKLDGDVGCMVNGAGLAMATMDVTSVAGASPANFLDVGGGADEDKVAEALKIILSDPNVMTVFINIFGGILRCDIVARGILKAVTSTEDRIRPMVVRMLGTNAELGRDILDGSDLDVVLVKDFSEATEALKALG